MIRRLSTLLLALMILGAVSSCKKKGCTDQNATNYDPKAKVDDGSCIYPPDSGTVTDTRDGQTYKFRRIGNQTWLAENMNYVTADSGNCYNDDPANCAEYGRLYTHTGSTQACPAGWHLPDDDEWLELFDFLGGISVAGDKMKVDSSSGWEGKYGGNALNASYGNLGLFGEWWSSTLSGTGYTCFQVGLGYTEVVGSYGGAVGYKRSCRCIQD